MTYIPPPPLHALGSHTQCQNGLSPLVTVCVITYNSSRYVSDTLHSVFQQEYTNLEIIVSDDCSTDNTLEVVRETADSAHRPVTIVTTDGNRGISGNYNNALRYAHGKWIKYIAGDDMLQPECISTFVQIAEHSSEKIYICGTLPFTNSGQQLPPRLLPIEWFDGSAGSQEKLIVKKGTIIEGPTLFLDRKTLIALGGFDEKYPFIEDYPLYMKFLSNGYRISLLPHCLIRYREYPESVSRGDSRFSTSILDAIDDWAVSAAVRHGMWLYAWHLSIDKWIRKGLIHSRIMGYALRLTDLIAWKKKLVTS